MNMRLKIPVVFYTKFRRQEIYEKNIGKIIWELCKRKETKIITTEASKSGFTDELIEWAQNNNNRIRLILYKNIIFPNWNIIF